MSYHRQIELRFYAGLICVFILATATWLALWTIVPALALGWQPVAITSDSMGPRIRQGDMVLAATHDGEGLDPGTVVVFEDAAGLGLITHRVVSRSGNGSYVTKGDGNANLDSTPLSPSQVVGVGRLLVPYVGTPLVWLWAARWVPLTALVVLASLVIRGARYGLWASHDPWRPVPALRPTGPSRPVLPPSAVQPRLALRCGLVLVMMAMTVMVGSGLAAAAFVDRTDNAPNSFAAKTSFADPVRLFLHSNPSPPIGDTVSQPLLPMDPTVPSATTLYKYDLDRDNKPGLVIVPGGTLGGADLTRRQLWSYPVVTDLRLRGTGTLAIWSANKNFTPNGAGQITARLQDCDPAGLSCATLAQGSFTQPSWTNGTKDWISHTVDMGWIPYTTVPAGRLLRLELVVGIASSDDLWFAYDTTSYPSVLSVQP